MVVEGEGVTARATRTSSTRDAESGDPVAHVLLHSGVFEESYAGYPADRL